ncbi:MAG: ATP-binding protein [Lachnospiraceae bacterium]|nr:ATP-binding protein [Lachnospiraceae bacterium]
MIGRNPEMKYLQSFYDRSEGQALVVYGEQGVGKRSLLQEFSRNKKVYSFQGRTLSEKELAYQWYLELGNTFPATDHDVTYSEILQSLLRDTAEKIVLIIYDFEYLLKAGDDFMESISHLFEQTISVQIILVSSSVGFVEHTMVSYLGEYASLIQGILKLKPLGFREFSEYFKENEFSEQIKMYAVLGGFSDRWNFFQPGLSFHENMCRNYLSKKMRLATAGLDYADRVLRETSVYHTILSGLASGKNKLHDLFLQTEFPRAKISVYLKNLIDLELVEKVVSFPIGEENLRKGIYRISNPFVLFYFTYIYPNLTAFNEYTAEAFFEKFVNPFLDYYMIQCYSRVCLAYMQELNKKKELPLHLKETGFWLGKSGLIDFVGRDENGKFITGGCHYGAGGFTESDFTWFQFCLDQAGITPDYIYLFSMTGFDQAVMKRVAKDPSLVLMDTARGFER